MQPLHLSLLLSLLATPLLTPKTTTTTTAVTEAAAVPASVPTPVMALALGDGLAQAKAPHRLYSRNARSLDSKLLRQGIDLSGLLKEQKERVKSSYKSSQAIERTQLRRAYPDGVPTAAADAAESIIIENTKKMVAKERANLNDWEQSQATKGGWKKPASAAEASSKAQRPKILDALKRRLAELKQRGPVGQQQELVEKLEELIALREGKKKAAPAADVAAGEGGAAEEGGQQEPGGGAGANKAEFQVGAPASAAPASAMIRRPSPLLPAVSRSGNANPALPFTIHRQKAAARPWGGSASAGALLGGALVGGVDVVRQVAQRAWARGGSWVF